MTTSLARPDAMPILADTEFQSWMERGREIWERHKESQWELACWWDKGERRWGESLQVAEDLGISPGYLHKTKYILAAAKEAEQFLPTGVKSTDLDFWKWQPLAHKALEPDERATLAEQAIKSKMTSRVLEATVREYLKAKSIPEPQQPQFSNGLKDGAEDDGLMLPPHGVTRGGGCNEGPDNDSRGIGTGSPSVTVPDALESLHRFTATEETPSEASGTYYDVKHPMEGGPDTTVPLTMETYDKAAALAEAGERELFFALSPECLHQIDLLRRYYKDPDMTAAQVIERAIGQLCQIKKDRLAKLA